jgi:hypothetical protein
MVERSVVLSDCAREVAASGRPRKEVVDSLVFVEAVDLDIARHIAGKGQAASFSWAWKEAQLETAIRDGAIGLPHSVLHDTLRNQVQADSRSAKLAELRAGERGLAGACEILRNSFRVQI